MRLPLPRWIAHRGGGKHAPENTLRGIRLAAALGYLAVEFDVMLSGSGSPVLIHDETLERTTNGSGLVAETPDALLFSLDAGQGETIPNLAEALQLCRDLRLMVNLEIKPASGHDIETTERTLGVLSKLWPDAGTSVLISSFSTQALGLAAKLAPSVPRGLLVDQIPENWQSLLAEFKATTLHCNATAANVHVLAQARELGIPVLCYTVNAPDMAKKLFNIGVKSLFTDALQLFASEATIHA